MTVHWDPAVAAAYLESADPVLGQAIRRLGPCRLTIEPPPTLFYALARAITHQQLHGKAAATIFARLEALLGEVAPESLLAQTDDSLRAVGLSHAKRLALQEIATQCRSGTVPAWGELQSLSDAEVIARLTPLRGVGVWTCEMLLMFRLGRPDILPLADFGIRKGFSRLLQSPEPPTPKLLAAYGQRWSPFRSAASWYLWRLADEPETREGPYPQEK